MRRLRKRTRDLVERLEREEKSEAVAVTAESADRMERERIARYVVQEDSKAERLGAATRLAPPGEPDCHQHNWYTPKPFPGHPSMPSSIVALRCPGCRQ